METWEFEPNPPKGKSPEVNEPYTFDPENDQLPPELIEYIEDQGITAEELAHPAITEILAIAAHWQAKLDVNQVGLGTVQEEIRVVMSEFRMAIEENRRMATQPTNNVGGQEPLEPQGVENATEENNQD